MCIFSGAVENVADTKILISIVYPSHLSTRDINGKKRTVKIPNTKQRPLQLVVYSNKVELGTPSALETSFIDEMPPIYDESYVSGTSILDSSSGNTAMVLPFPLRKGPNRVKIINLSNYAGIFEDLELLFPSTDRGIATSLMTNEDSLEVQYIGNYKASIIPNWNSFDKLQFNKFNLSPDTKELLGKFYRKDYGFMVCQLLSSRQNGVNHQYHPFAYCHEVREDGRLFIPTRHYHKKPISNPFTKYHTLPTFQNQQDEDDSQSESLRELDDHFMNTLSLEDRWLQMNIRKKNIEETKMAHTSKIDWDHEIFIINCPRVRRNPLLINKQGVGIASADVNKLKNIYHYLDPSKIPPTLAFGQITSLHKIKITSSYKYNHDIFV
jgi:hypothetical protein